MRAPRLIQSERPSTRNSVSGVGQVQIAGGFVRSQEFIDLYGAAPTNADLVTKLYRNILDRDPEQAARDREQPVSRIASEMLPQKHLIRLREIANGKNIKIV